MPRQYMVQTQAGLLGPLSEAKILEYASNGVLHPTDQVQRIGREGTYAASTIRGFRAAPPPLEPQAACPPIEPPRASEHTDAAATRGAATGGSRFLIPVAIVAVIGLIAAGAFVASSPRPASPTKLAIEPLPEPRSAEAPITEATSTVEKPQEDPSPASAEDAAPEAVTTPEQIELVEPVLVLEEEPPEPETVTQLVDQTQPEAPAVEPPPLPVLARGPYVVIPMHGEVGKALLVEGIETAVEAARVAGAKTIVFDIDSGGGMAMEARPLANAVLNAGRFATTVALIHNAHSAAVFPAVACHEIVMLPGSAIGATVAYSGELGATEVNAKFNSALNAELAGIAKTRGHTPHLVEAMGVPVHEVWIWEDESTGRMQSGNVAPEEGTSTRIDDSATVLTLSADRAIALGFAYAGDEQGISWEFEDWKEIERGMAARHMRVAVDQRRVANRQREREARAQMRELERLRGYQHADLAQLADWVGRLPSYADYAKSKEPLQYDDYFYHTDTGLWTTQSMVKWRTRTDEAIKAWNTVRLGVEDIAERMKELDLVESLPEVRESMEYYYQQSLNRIRFLQANRERQ